MNIEIMYKICTLKIDFREYSLKALSYLKHYNMPSTFITFEIEFNWGAYQLSLKESLELPLLYNTLKAI